jgi:hypothetical protein
VLADPVKKTEPRRPFPERLAAPLREVFEGAAEGVRTSAAIVRAAPLEPPRTGRLARVGYGFALPLAVMRVILRDPLERRRFLIQASVRAILVFTVAALIAGSGLLATIKLDIFSPGADFKVKAEIVGALLSTAYMTLAVIEWIVIAFTHEFDSQVGRRASLRAGVEPEDEEQKPRVRLDMKWIGKRIKRGLRGYRVYFVGIPAISLTLLIPLVGKSLYSLLLGLWSLYWLVVLTASKSAAAWVDEGLAPAPWFLRFWSFVINRVPGFRWGLPRLYGREWRKLSEAIFSPCKAVEDAPWSLLGLALCRVVLGFPGVYLFIRPFIPVAAAHIIAKSRRPDIPETTP